MNNYDNLQFFPIVGLKISNKCRMHCQFCCEAFQNREVYPIDRYITIINMLASVGVKRICYTGGEPLLNDDIGKMVESSKHLGIENIIVTSDGALMKKLSIPREYIDAVRVSVHGISSVHDRIAKKQGAFDSIDSALSKNKTYRIQVSTVLTPNVVPELDDIVQWCIKRQVSRFYLLNLLNSGYGDSFIQNNGRISSEEFIEVLNKLNNKYGKQIEIVGHPYTKNAECILIYGDGDVLVDPYFNSDTHQKVIGNIIKQTPSEVFNNFKNDADVYNDYLSRLSHSTLK